MPLIWRTHAGALKPVYGGSHGGENTGRWNDKKFWWAVAPGLLWMLVNIVHASPPIILLFSGHPGVSYYSYSFLHYAYSDVVALYGARRLFLHTVPYFQNVIEYPVGIGIYMSLMAYLPGFWGYWIASVAGLMIAFLLTLYPLYQARGMKTALWFSMSPLLAVYGVLNWDLLGILCWAWGVFLFERARYGWAGAFIGLGIAVKFFPIVMVPYFGTWLWMHRRDRLKGFVGGLGIAVGATNLPFALFAESGWSNFFTYNSGRAPDPGFYRWLVQAGVLHVGNVDLVSAGLTMAGGTLLLALMLRYQWNPAGVVAVALTWWFLCNKVYSPQYMLWVYVATLWMGVDTGLLVMLNLVGLLDFWLAMRWLGLGTTDNPSLGEFVRTFVGPVLGARYLGLLLAVVLTSRRSHRQRNRWGCTPNAPPVSSG